MKTTNLPELMLKWGIEEMGDTLYVGPLRPNSAKLFEIAFTIAMHGYKDEAKNRHRDTAELIVKAVNEYNIGRMT